MIKSRRSFLRSGTLATAIAGFLPFSIGNGRDKNLPNNKNVNVDLIVRPNSNADYFASRFHSDRDVRDDFTRKVSNFYRNMGAHYGLQGVELNFNVLDKDTEIPKTLTPGRFTLINTTREEAMANEIDDLAKDQVGHYRVLERMVKERLGEKLSGPQLELVVNQLLTDYLGADFVDPVKSGYAILAKDRGYFFQSNDEDDWTNDTGIDRKNLVNARATIAAHELGHLFGLDHLEEGSLPSNNLMTPWFNRERMSGFDVSVSRDQVRRILRPADIV